VKWRQTHKEKCHNYEINRISETRKAQHRKSHHKRRNKILPQQRARVLKIKTEVISHYSNNSMKCDLCPENRLYALGLDHINGGGIKHRKEIGGGSHLYRWIIKNNYPIDFRILCHNCNWLVSLKPRKDGWENDRQYRLRDQLKHEVLSSYSNGKVECAICKMNDIRVLSVDHINRNGIEHRRTLKVTGGSQLYRRLRQAGFPSGLRVLCMSCNLADYASRNHGDFGC